jgi:alkaline phosphatase
MENTLFNFFRSTSIFKAVAAMITALNLLFNLFVSVTPPVGEPEIVKNVIILIGDGMGENTLELAKQERGIDLFMETIPVRGQSETRSFNSTVTDSAAGGTALACGVRTNNGCIGVFPHDVYAFVSYPANITELAMEQGKKAGIVTTDSNTGATPASFSAHTYLRTNADYIATQQVNSGIDLIWSAASDETTANMCTSNGYAYITTRTELLSLKKGQKSFGQFSSDLWRAEKETDTPTLVEMTDKAIELLDNEDGFFLMVEGAHIDKNSHDNNVEGAVEAVYEFDKAVQAAVKFAENDGNTLVIVTADHETGAITLVDDKYVYTSGSHSGANVPLFVYGSNSFIENGQVVKNIDVARFMAFSMGYADGYLPCEVMVTDESGLYRRAS